MPYLLGIFIVVICIIFIHSLNKKSFSKQNNIGNDSTEANKKDSREIEEIEKNRNQFETSNKTSHKLPHGDKEKKDQCIAKPEMLPLKKEVHKQNHINTFSSNDIGKIVFHNNFGYGTIELVDHKYVTVNFEELGTKDFQNGKVAILELINDDEDRNRKVILIKANDNKKEADKTSSRYDKHLFHDYEFGLDGRM